MKIINIDSLENFKNILENNCNVIVNVSASWCKPCQNIKNDLEIFITNYNSESIFVKLDYDIYDDDDNFTDYITIKKVPTFVLFENSINTKEIISSDLNIIKNFINNNISENNTFIIDDNF